MIQLIIRNIGEGIYNASRESVVDGPTDCYTRFVASPIFRKTPLTSGDKSFCPQRTFLASSWLLFATRPNLSVIKKGFFVEACIYILIRLIFL